MRTKLVLGLLFAVAAFLVAFMPAATGSTRTDPPTPPAAGTTSTNVPYLAWNGEEVKLVKCYGADFDAKVADQTEAGFFALYKADFNVLAWTGDPANKPTLESGTVHAGWGRNGLCVSGDFVSLSPGLATIELDVTPLAGGDVAFPKHVFLSAWMNLMKPAITELSNAGLTALSANQDLGDYGFPVSVLHENYSVEDPTTPMPAKNVMLGDPAGDGKFVPIPDGNKSPVNRLLDGLISVSVKGQFPNGAGGMWTMPDDWVALATQYAVGVNGPDKMLWNIHGAPAWNPMGPYDPLRADETVLSDLVLTTADAPMPAARIDFKIAAGGVGGFDEAMKSTIFIKDAMFSPGTTLTGGALNAYEPFYQQEIPATAGMGVSGIDGPASGNNFQGFLVDGKYSNWDVVTPKAIAVSDPMRGTNPNVCKDEFGNVRTSPVDVPDTASVYTDEHGQAFVAYNPDKGFYFTANVNQLCDLGENVPVNATASTASTPVLLGTSAITATAYYPYKPVAPLTGFPSDTLTKQVFGDPAKFLRVVQKDDRLHAFAVEVIRDIYGNPVKGAVVQFTVEPGGKLIPASLKYAGFDTTDQSVLGNPVWPDPTAQTVFAKTGAHGQVGVEVVSTLGAQVDLLAENLLTRNGGSGIIRDACINYSGAAITATYGLGCNNVAPPVTTTGATTTVINTTTTVAGGGGGGGGGTTTVTTTAPTTTTTTEQQTTTNVVTTSGQTKVLAAKVVTAKLVSVKLTGARVVYVKVNSAAKNVTIKVKLLSKTHSVIKSVNVSVPTNKLVKLGLAVPKTVRGVTAGVVR